MRCFTFLIEEKLLQIAERKNADIDKKRIEP